jgi:small subunit ribosomal protein S15
LTRRGKSRSRRPVSKRPPAWVRYSAEEVENYVLRLGKEEVPPSEIGVILRDRYGIPLVKPIVGKSILRILEDGGLKAPIPEDLHNLMQKANTNSVHLARNRSDHVAKRTMQLTLDKIRALAHYYKDRGVLPEDWEFRPETF